MHPAMHPANPATHLHGVRQRMRAPGMLCPSPVECSRAAPIACARRPEVRARPHASPHSRIC
eukprot:scaffold63484_cov66-Phaeocystis_antarctica.AAC.2